MGRLSGSSTNDRMKVDSEDVLFFLRRGEGREEGFDRFSFFSHPR